MKLRNRFTAYVDRRSKLDLNDSFAIYKCWDELIEMLSEDEMETIELLETASKEEVDWISEVMEDVAQRLDSTAYIDSLRIISKKYPACNLEDIIEISIRFMNTKFKE